MVPVLRDRLHARLAELEHERRVIRRALAALEIDRPRAPRRRRAADQRVLDAIRADPGIRASLIGLELGLPAETVTGALQQLEAAGRIERLGLGWRTNL
jgi:hypothetical protein